MIKSRNQMHVAVLKKQLAGNLFNTYATKDKHYGRALRHTFDT
jgi:hypothetical protein